MSTYGLSQVSEGVGLNFSELRKRLRQENGLESKEPSLNFLEETQISKMEFVELPIPSKKRPLKCEPIENKDSDQNSAGKHPLNSFGRLYLSTVGESVYGLAPGRTKYSRG